MKRVKLLALAALALLAFGAVNAAIAGAETEPPEILCLVAKCGSEIKVPLTGTTSTLFTLAGLTIEGTGVTTTLEGKLCKVVGAEEKDLSLCTDVPIDFTGTKTKKTVACRSEAVNGSDKDAVETILALLDLHLASEEGVVAGVKGLYPLLLARVLGPLLEAELGINCGGIKSIVKGTVGCLLLPGLKEIPTTGTVELVCKVKTNDQESGTCNVLCALLTEFPYLSSLGTGFEDAAQEIKLTGKPSKDLLIDD